MNNFIDEDAIPGSVYAPRKSFIEPIGDGEGSRFLSGDSGHKNLANGLAAKSTTTATNANLNRVYRVLQILDQYNMTLFIQSYSLFNWANTQIPEPIFFGESDGFGCAYSGSGPVEETVENN